jgi:hypothetical protein
MGKLVIVLVSIAVAIGMITTFSDQVEDTTPTTDEEEQGLEIVEVSGPHTKKVSKIADLITLCHERSLEEGFKNLECFVARSESGDFSITKSELESNLPSEIESNTNFLHTNYDRESVIITYEVNPGEVVVEK